MARRCGEDEAHRRGGVGRGSDCAARLAALVDAGRATAQHGGPVIPREIRMDVSPRPVPSAGRSCRAPIPAAAEFYGALFGWTFDAMQMQEPGSVYHVIKLGDAAVGGIMNTPPGAAGMPPMWGCLRDGGRCRRHRQTLRRARRQGHRRAHRHSERRALRRHPRQAGRGAERHRLQADAGLTPAAGARERARIIRAPCPRPPPTPSRRSPSRIAARLRAARGDRAGVARASGHHRLRRDRLGQDHAAAQDRAGRSAAAWAPAARA